MKQILNKSYVIKFVFNLCFLTFQMEKNLENYRFFRFNLVPVINQRFENTAPEVWFVCPFCNLIESVSDIFDTLFFYSGANLKQIRKILHAAKAGKYMAYYVGCPGCEELVA